MSRRKVDSEVKAILAAGLPDVGKATWRRRAKCPTTLTLDECKQVWIDNSGGIDQVPSCQTPLMSQAVQRQSMINAATELLNVGAYHPSARVKQIALACLGALQLAAAIEADAKAATHVDTTSGGQVDGPGRVD